jgi:hypothetical protein
MCFASFCLGCEHEGSAVNGSAGLPVEKNSKVQLPGSAGAKLSNTFVSRPRLFELFKGATTEQKLFDGLKVRMGIATGYVESQTYGRDGVKNSPLHEMAKGKY